MLDFRSLEAFAAVISEGGFEKAGTALGLTQSAVSQRVRQLEQFAGAVLVVRENPPRASASGEHLLRLYAQTRSLETEALAGARGAPATGFEQMTIAVNADSLAVWFLEATLPFWLSRPALFDLRVDDQERTLRFLKSGEACACLSARGESVVGCISTRLGAMEYRLCAAPAYAARFFPDGFTAGSAASAPVIHYNRDDGLQRMALRACFGAAAPEPPAYYLPSTERIFDTVKAGIGYCMIPRVQAEGALRVGDLVELSSAARTRVDLFWHRWSLVSASLDELTGLLVRKAGEYLEV
ncbi:MAG: transcriptional regulator ArgP [Treponema sp. RIFOXYC1_FULL_61_9]|nr:MAG: transcriptional regulator ArgP [Treponema sp. GWC1_61_84]OHE75966.1 MAG: transcriptional regulator ArgP [Treponema sp. RIFOXYC1_FULL_61_9]